MLPKLMFKHDFPYYWTALHWEVHPFSDTPKESHLPNIAIIGWYIYDCWLKSTVIAD